MKTKMKWLVLFLCLTLTFCALISCGKGSNEAGMDRAPAGDGAAESGGKPNGAKEITPADAERKIIKTYTVSAESKDFDAAVAALEQSLAKVGGYVENSSVYGGGSLTGNTVTSRRASYTLRIPAEQAENFLQDAGTLFHIRETASAVEDVSDSYYSIEARLEELGAERDSLLQIMESLNTQQDYSFWLTVEERLSAVRQEIAVYQRLQMNYDNRISYSTVTLYLNEVGKYSAVEQPGFFSRLRESFCDGWSNFADGAQDFAVWFVGALPVLLLLAAVAVAAILIIRRARKKKKAALRAQNARETKET